MKTKVLISIDDDVLALVDKRAEQRGMSRSGYVTACCLGLCDGVYIVGVDPGSPEGDTTAVVEVSLCQYCDHPRKFVGHMGRARVSLCDNHRAEHKHDFDSIEAVSS